MLCCCRQRQHQVVVLLLLIGIATCTVWSFVIPCTVAPNTVSVHGRCKGYVFDNRHEKTRIGKCRIDGTQQFSLSSDDELASRSHPQERTATEHKITPRNLLNAAFLIAGTTVGGGFLALPNVVAPNGFLPSAVALVGVWIYFWMESMVLVECLVLCRKINQVQGQQEESTSTTSSSPGIAAAAKTAFGSVGEIAILILLVLLTQATLVSQISRAGAFFPFYRFGCAVTAIAAAGLVFGTPNYIVMGTNSLLTFFFCIMAVILFGTGAPAADWSKLGLFSSWATIPRAIPTFLQLLVYGEILPAVCQLLKYRLGPIRWAISIGSLLPLILEVGWAALGIGLLPTTSGGASLGITTDPVNLLLAAGPVQVPLFALAVTAISTTIIGSYLALQSAMDDVFAKPLPIMDSATTCTDDNSRHAGGRRRQVVSALWIVLPALGIASISPNLFLQAIDFAGSYPVLLLWGLAPPAIAFRLRQKIKPISSSTSMTMGSLLPAWWLVFLASLSFVLFGMSAVPDLMSLIKLVKSF
jgi:tyrosine-specific transport protein